MSTMTCEYSLPVAWMRGLTRNCQAENWTRITRVVRAMGGKFGFHCVFFGSEAFWRMVGTGVFAETDEARQRRRGHQHSKQINKISLVPSG